MKIKDGLIKDVKLQVEPNQVILLIKVVEEDTYVRVQLPEYPTFCGTQLQAKIAALESELKMVSGSSVEKTEIICSVREKMRQLSAVQ